MAKDTVCTNCGKTVKYNWLICKNCNQPNWPLIRPYYIWGALFLVFAWWSIAKKPVFTFPGFGDLLTALLPIFGGVLGFIGVVMLLVAIITSLRGLGVKDVKPATPAPVAPTTTNQAGKAPSIANKPMVIRLSDAGLPEVNQVILRSIDDQIRYANSEVNWDFSNVVPGQVDRARIPFNTRTTIDYLLDEHPLTHDTTYSHLLKLGNDGLRERIIRILGAMGTEKVVPMLERFAANDPLKTIHIYENPDPGSNATYASNSDYVYPLRKLAQEEIQKVKSRIL